MASATAPSQGMEPSVPRIFGTPTHADTVIRYGNVWGRGVFQPGQAQSLSQGSGAPVPYFWHLLHAPTRIGCSVSLVETVTHIQGTQIGIKVV